MDEILRRLVWRANCQAFIPPSDGRKERRKQKHKLLALIEELPYEQLEDIFAVLSGTAYIKEINGSPYRVMRTELGFSFRCLKEGSQEHTVNLEMTACSCPDYKYRERECKHMRALK